MAPTLISTPLCSTFLQWLQNTQKNRLLCATTRSSDVKFKNNSNYQLQNRFSQLCMWKRPDCGHVHSKEGGPSDNCGLYIQPGARPRPGGRARPARPGQARAHRPLLPQYFILHSHVRTTIITYIVQFLVRGTNKINLDDHYLRWAIPYPYRLLIINATIARILERL